LLLHVCPPRQREGLHLPPLFVLQDPLLDFQLFLPDKSGAAFGLSEDLVFLLLLFPEQPLSGEVVLGFDELHILADLEVSELLLFLQSLNFLDFPVLQLLRLGDPLDLQRSRVLEFSLDGYSPREFQFVGKSMFHQGYLLLKKDI
jgi:hypothetical protein